MNEEAVLFGRIAGRNRYYAIGKQQLASRPAFIFLNSG